MFSHSRLTLLKKRKMDGLFSIGVILACVATFTTAYGRKAVYFESMTNCHQRDINYTIFMKNISIGMLAPDISEYNATMVVLNDYGPIKLTFGMYKCNTAGGLDCEEIMNVPYSDFCLKFTEENQFWSPFTENLEPRLQCPLRKGMYKATHVRLDADLAAQYLEPNIFYKLTYVMTDQNAEIGCITFIARIMGIKSKNGKVRRTKN